MLYQLSYTPKQATILLYMFGGGLSRVFLKKFNIIKNNVDSAAIADATVTASAASRMARHMKRVSMPGAVYF